MLALAPSEMGFSPWGMDSAFAHIRESHFPTSRAHCISTVPADAGPGTSSAQSLFFTLRGAEPGRGRRIVRGCDVQDIDSSFGERRFL